jgi:NAD(P)-dependent dehydrogenase (short-subunit alcohol dehydrogenase family)
VALPLVLLADLPPMLEDMLSGMLKERFDFEVVHGLSGGRDLVGTAAAKGASVVVVARNNPSDLASIDSALSEASALTILAVALDGTSACTHVFRPAQDRIEDVSSKQILAAISKAAAPRSH